MVRTFSASVGRYGKLTLDKMRDVMRESIQDVIEDAQTPVAKGGRMPVDTGFLRNSVASGLNGAFGPPDSGLIALTIAGMDLGDTSQFAWTAVYAMIQEDRNHFVAVAAARFPDRVAANARKAAAQ